MSDPLSDYLESNVKPHADLSADTLELMGKRAANMFLDFGTSLNEGVLKIASEYKDINSDQIKRVVEHANTSVYLTQHDKNKIAGRETSYPQFELADSDKVLQSLKGTPVHSSDSSYSTKFASKSKTASKADLDQVFGQSFGKTKTADINYGIDSGVDELMIIKHNSEDNMTHLEYTHSEVLSMFKEASTEYYELVKRFMLDGGDFSHIMAAARSTEAEDEKIASVMKPITQKLMQEKVASARDLQKAILNLEKVAYRVINTEHPLVTKFASVMELDQEVNALEYALNKTAEAYGIASEAINEIFLGKSAK